MKRGRRLAGLLDAAVFFKGGLGHHLLKGVPQVKEKGKEKRHPVPAVEHGRTTYFD